jgi:cytidylate kinase
LPFIIVREPLVIAIDGPAGAGKSTVAQKLARELGLPYVDSGATYRAAALKVLESAIPPDEEARIVELVHKTAVEVVAAPQTFRVLLDGIDVTGQIRSPEAARLASIISAIPEVRESLIALQRRFARGRGVVMEGRDIGTVVLPDAPLKIFLTASPLERVRRRMGDELSTGRGLSFQDVARQIEQRDRRDSERKFSPLVPAADAHLIDSTHLNATDVVRQILELLKTRHLIEGCEPKEGAAAGADSA